MRVFSSKKKNVLTGCRCAQFPCVYAGREMVNKVVLMSSVFVLCVAGILDPGGGCGQRGGSASRVLPPQEVRRFL